MIRSIEHHSTKVAQQMSAACRLRAFGFSMTRSAASLLWLAPAAAAADFSLLLPALWASNINQEALRVAGARKLASSLFPRPWCFARVVYRAFLPYHRRAPWLCPFLQLASPRLASPLDRAIKHYHDFMPDATSRKHMAAMTAGLSNAMNEQGKLTVGSARSGTDIAYKVLEHLVGFVGPWMERPPQLRHIFGCERAAAKQLFLRQQYDLVHLLSCVSLLAQRTAHCEIQGKLVFVPECSVFSAGFSCKSRTPCSSKSAANRNCTQRQETEPAFTFQHIYAYIVNVSPHL